MHTRATRVVYAKYEEGLIVKTEVIKDDHWLYIIEKYYKAWQ